MQASTNVLKNRLACERGTHASSSVGVTNDASFGPLLQVSSTADAPRTLFTQKAWQKSNLNVRAFQTGMDEGVDQSHEACFQSLQMPVQLPAHTQGQFHDKRTRRFFDDAASRWNSRRKQMGGSRFNVTASSIDFPRASTSTGNYESAGGMHRSTDHFFDQGSLKSGEHFRSKTNQGLQARKDIPLKIDPNVENKQSQRKSSRRSNSKGRTGSTNQAMPTPINVEVEYFQQKAQMPWHTGPSETNS